MNKKIDAVASATTRLIEDLTAFNMDYSGDLKVKTKKDDHEKTEKLLYVYKETLSKVNLSSQSSICQDYIPTMALTIESSFKAELAPILNLFIHLPTNAPCYVHVLQGGERGVGSSKGYNEDTGVVVGKVFSTQIATTIPMKPISSITTTTNDPQENMDWSKL